MKNMHGLHSWHGIASCIRQITNLSWWNAQSLVPQQEGILIIDVKLVDSSELVHIHDHKKYQIPIKTFQDYSQLVFLPHIICILQEVVRVYVSMSTEKIA